MLGRRRSKSSRRWSALFVAASIGAVSPRRVHGPRSLIRRALNRFVRVQCQPARLVGCPWVSGLRSARSVRRLRGQPAPAPPRTVSAMGATSAWLPLTTRRRRTPRGDRGHDRHAGRSTNDLLALQQGARRMPAWSSGSTASSRPASWAPTWRPPSHGSTCLASRIPLVAMG